MNPAPISRRGSVFLFVIGVMLVCFALAAGLVMSTTRDRTSAQQYELSALSRHAAQAGIAHAIGEIHRSFTARPGEPTHLSGGWRQAFLPIDTLEVGSGTLDPSDDHPTGQPNSPHDTNGNDVPIENLLTEVGMPWVSQRYRFRRYLYNVGLVSEGVGRWFELGVHSDDPAAKPISFHLDHPNGGDAALGAAWDGTADKRGEPYTPDQNRPIYYAGDLEAWDGSTTGATDPDLRARARYRLRYAVAIEDLGGHLRFAIPGAFDPNHTTAVPHRSPGGSPATVGTPTAADRLLTNEVDNAIADRYAPVLAAMQLESNVALQQDLHQLMFRGLGHHRTGNGVTVSSSTPPTHGFPVLAGRRGDELLLNYTDWDRTWDATLNLRSYPPGEQNLVVDSLQVIDGNRSQNTAYTLVGPMHSFDHLGTTANAYNKLEIGNAPKLQALQPHVFAPHGHPIVPSANPQRWYESYTDCPWRVNLATAPPAVIFHQLAPLMPQEMWAAVYERTTKKRYAGKTPSGAHLWDDAAIPDDHYPIPNPPVEDGNWGRRRGLRPVVDVHHHLASIADFAALGGLAGTIPDLYYPGTRVPSDPNKFADPVGMHAGNYALGDKPESASDHGIWRIDLGRHINVSDKYTLGGPPRSPFRGQHDRYYYENYSLSVLGSITERYEVFPGGEQWTRNASGDWRPRNFGEDTAKPGFWDPDTVLNTYVFYPKSFYFDVIAAVFNTISVTQYAWMDRSASTSTPGREVRWPAGLPAGFFAPGGSYTPGGLCRDRDLDGDGIGDVPAVLDTIAEVDRLFLRNLGIDPDNPAASDDRVDAGQMLPIQGMSVPAQRSNAGELDKLHDVGDHVPVVYSITHNIRSLVERDYDYDGDGEVEAVSDEQAALMELVVNDIRMSLFGSSPQYPDFQPGDFDGDGTVRCSAYPNGNAPAQGNGYGPTPRRRFSISGCFVLQKSRFYRYWVRGEVYDELTRSTAAQTNFEGVYVVDPDGDMYDVNDLPLPASARSTGMNDSHVLFQREVQNKYHGTRFSGLR